MILGLVVDYFGAHQQNKYVKDTERIDDGSVLLVLHLPRNWMYMVEDCYDDVFFNVTKKKVSSEVVQRRSYGGSWESFVAREDYLCQRYKLGKNSSSTTRGCRTSGNYTVT